MLRRVALRCFDCMIRVFFFYVYCSYLSPLGQAPHGSLMISMLILWLSLISQETEIRSNCSHICMGLWNTLCHVLSLIKHSEFYYCYASFSGELCGNSSMGLYFRVFKSDSLREFVMLFLLRYLCIPYNWTPISLINRNNVSNWSTVQIFKWITKLFGKWRWVHLETYVTYTWQ